MRGGGGGGGGEKKIGDKIKPGQNLLFRLLRSFVFLELVGANTHTHKKEMDASSYSSESELYAVNYPQTLNRDDYHFNGTVVMSANGPVQVSVFDKIWRTTKQVVWFVLAVATAVAIVKLADNFAPVPMSSPVLNDTITNDISSKDAVNAIHDLNAFYLALKTAREEICKPGARVNTSSLATQRMCACETGGRSNNDPAIQCQVIDCACNSQNCKIDTHMGTIACALCDLAGFHTTSAAHDASALSKAWPPARFCRTLANVDRK